LPVLLVGCGGSAGTPTTITLAGLIDRTGSNATPGWMAGATLAMNDMNAALKTAQYKNLQFDWLFGDTTSSAMTTATLVFAQELQGVLNLMPAEFDAFSANAYDGAIVLMLGVLQASANQADPTSVTGAQVRDAMQHLNDPAGTTVRTGPAALAAGITLISQGKAINYDGASGPVDWDALGNVVTRLTHFSIENQQFVDHEEYDCVASPDCPRVN